MAVKVLTYLWGTVTQGSADAFKESTIATGLAAGGGLCWRVHEIAWQFPPFIQASGQDISLSLTRKTMSAEPTILERSLISKRKRYCNFTTSGEVTYEGIIIDKLLEQENLLIVEDTVYFQIDSSATTGTNTAYVRLGVTQEKISDVDRLSLVAAALGG